MLILSYPSPKQPLVLRQGISLVQVNCGLSVGKVMDLSLAIEYPHIVQFIISRPG